MYHRHCLSDKHDCVCWCVRAFYIYEHITHFNAGSRCSRWCIKHLSKHSHNFGIELDKTNVGQGRVLSARSCAKLSHVFLWHVYVCFCVLGIDSLVRSLKEALRLTNLEVPKQGLLLLTEILERWDCSVMLFLFRAFMSCPNAKIIPLHWMCSFLENSCTEHLCSVTKMMPLQFGFSTLPTVCCHITGG